MATLNLPSTLRELNSLTYATYQAEVIPVAPPQIPPTEAPAQPEIAGEIVMIGDLTTTALVNTSGTLLVAGRKLTVLDATSVTGPGAIDMTNGSTVEITGQPMPTGDVMKFDRTTNLILRDCGIPFGATAALPVLFQLNNVTLIANGAVAEIRNNFTGHATLEIFGNLNIISEGANAAILRKDLAASDFTLTVHGDVSIVAKAAGAATLNLIDMTFNTYGLVNTVSEAAGIASMITGLKASPGTTINILGSAKQFQFPRKATAYAIGSLVIDRPAGARFNNEVANPTVDHAPEIRHTFGGVDGHGD
jgi:hypothetical protein